jgi:hypothetical protein
LLTGIVGTRHIAGLRLHARTVALSRPFKAFVSLTLFDSGGCLRQWNPSRLRSFTSYWVFFLTREIAAGNRDAIHGDISPTCCVVHYSWRTSFAKEPSSALFCLECSPSGFGCAAPEGKLGICTAGRRN